MSTEPLINYLGRLCKELREVTPGRDGKKITRRSIEKAAQGSRYAEQSADGLTAGTLERFENARYQAHWPRRPDFIVQLYADAFGVPARVLWEMALQRKHGVLTTFEADEIQAAEVRAAEAQKKQRVRATRRRRNSNTRKRSA